MSVPVPCHLFGLGKSQPANLILHPSCAPADVAVDTLLRALADNRHLLAFFNDVELADTYAWAPAMDYVATKGFFPEHNARPNDPRSKPVAQAWQSILTRSGIPDFDATTSAAEVAAAKNYHSLPLNPLTCTASRLSPVSPARRSASASTNRSECAFPRVDYIIPLRKKVAP